MFVSAYTEVRNGDLATKSAERSLRALSFLYNYDMSLGNTFMVMPQLKEVADKVAVKPSDNVNVKKIFLFDKQLQNLSEKLHSETLKTIHYYSRYLQLWDAQLFEEGFLSVFKGLEIISNYVYREYLEPDFVLEESKIVTQILMKIFNEEYKDKDKDKDIQKSVKDVLDQLVTMRRKIVSTARHLKYPSLDEEIENIANAVRLRNRAGAHGASHDDHEFNVAYHLASISKFLIARIVMGEDYGMALLDFELR